PGEVSELEKVAQSFEESYKSPGITVDDALIPSVEAFRDAIQDVAEDLQIRRFNVLFDEAAHIFRPEQQRQFFTLFRDLRSPYMSCNAAVYPGVTSYGPTFQLAHDATVVEINRSLFDGDYRDSMLEIVRKQADAQLLANIE